MRPEINCSSEAPSSEASIVWVLWKLCSFWQGRNIHIVTKPAWCWWKSLGFHWSTANKDDISLLTQRYEPLENQQLFTLPSSRLVIENKGMNLEWWFWSKTSWAQPGFIVRVYYILLCSWSVSQFDGLMTLRRCAGTSDKHIFCCAQSQRSSSVLLLLLRHVWCRPDFYAQQEKVVMLLIFKAICLILQKPNVPAYAEYTETEAPANDGLRLASLPGEASVFI